MHETLRRRDSYLMVCDMLRSGRILGFMLCGPRDKAEPQGSSGRLLPKSRNLLHKYGVFIEVFWDLSPYKPIIFQGKENVHL
jgi:hypothetical protein